jgi:hypothetical protein
VADFIKVFQSSREVGEKSFVPDGQLFLSFERRTSKQLSHLRRNRAEYFPLSSTFLQVQPFGLPVFGASENFTTWQ